MSAVVSMFGQPTTRSVSSDGSITITYAYAHTQVRPETFIPYIGAFIGGADTRSNSATLRFGADGKLIDYSSSNSEMGAGIGFAAGSTQPRTAQPVESAAPTAPSPSPNDKVSANETSTNPPISSKQEGTSQPAKDLNIGSRDYEHQIKSKGSAHDKLIATADLYNQGKISREERDRFQAAILRGDL